MTINVNDVETVGSATYTGASGGDAYYDLGATGHLIIQGTVSIQDGVVNDNSIGVWAWQWPGVSILEIASGGALQMNVSGSGSSATGFDGSVQANFINNGIFSVQSGWQSIGVYLFNAGTFVNAGSYTVVGGSNGALGVAASGASGATTAITNSGSISVSSTGAYAQGFDLASPGTFTNSGTITVTNTGGPAFGIREESSTGGTETIVNTGTITAATAISGGTQPGNIVLTNSGSINGDIILGLGAGQEVHNAGAIHGSVTFNGVTGTQFFDARGGSVSGTITFASAGANAGSAVAYLGAGGETLVGGAAALTAYGGAGNDTITGGTSADFITSGGGNDTLTGGAGADTFAFRVPSGSVTITDFSHAQGDKIDLSAFGTDWNLVQVAMTGTTNTVLSFGGWSITLTGVAPGSLSAADFVFGPVTVLPTDDFLIYPSAVISRTTGPLVEFTGLGGKLTNSGSMSLTTTGAANGVVSDQSINPTALFVNTGTFRLTAGSTAGSVGVSNVSFENKGTFSVAGDGSVTGVWDAGPSGSFSNGDSGGAGASFSVTSTSASALGVELDSGVGFSSYGPFSVSGSGIAYGLVYIAASSNTIEIHGPFTVTGSYSMGVWFQNGGSGSVDLKNYGTITADDAIYYGDNVGGSIYNAGTINGAVVSVNYDIVLDSSAGTINGVVKLGASGTVTLGAENNTVQLANGAHLVDGGGGTNTVSYTNAASGVTVRLGLQGQSQNTGVGIDTLTHFQALVGSSHNDTLEGGGSGATSLTGGAGADTFVFGAGDDAVTVTDFSRAQGDKVDLSRLGAFADLNDVLGASSQVGSDTVIAAGSSSLRLHNVSMASLTASDFAFFAPAATVTGASGNNFTATFDGAYRQYTVWRDGAAVTGGPEGAIDALAGVHRIQFVDGYLDFSPTDPAGQVYRLYEATLGRAPDQAGLTSWVNGLNGGTSLQSVVNGFVGSQEFQAVYGANLSNSDFVTLLYNNVLGRAPDQAGLTNWVGLLTSGQDTRAQVVLGFSESQEDIHSSAAAVGQGLWVANPVAGEVARMYDTVFGRLPDASGLANWTSMIQGGMSLQTAANGFVGSTEFQSVYGNLNNNDFVTLLYNNVLHRAPDQAGLTNWVNLLTSGQDTRAQVVIGFSESPEHIVNAAPHIDSGVWLA